MRSPNECRKRRENKADMVFVASPCCRLPLEYAGRGCGLVLTQYTISDYQTLLHYTENGRGLLVRLACRSQYAVRYVVQGSQFVICMETAKRLQRLGESTLSVRRARHFHQLIEG